MNYLFEQCGEFWKSVHNDTLLHPRHIVAINFKTSNWSEESKTRCDIYEVVDITGTTHQFESERVEPSSDIKTLLKRNVEHLTGWTEDVE
ncbi:MAG: hypothetical protein F4Z14_01705 [Gammaproteobacteria bacterium]|nr:hypothetical protein [Gammaproteobacteria bacterium]